MCVVCLMCGFFVFCVLCILGESCASGSYSLAGYTACVSVCPAGSYSSSGGGCAVCSTGRYSNVTGASSSATCATCSPGKYSLAGYSSCMSCSAGSYSSGSGSYQCAACNAGTYSTVSGATTSSVCVGCPSGYYSDYAGSSQCIAFPSNSGITNSNTPTNIVTIAGRNYATLANTVSGAASAGSSGSSGSLCQNYYLALPVGWIVAPNNCQSWFALGCFSWQTQLIVLADGNEYYGLEYGSSKWSIRYSSYGLSRSGDGRYSIGGNCNAEILITDDINAESAACPSNPSSCSLCVPGTYSSNGATQCKKQLNLSSLYSISQQTNKQ